MSGRVLLLHALLVLAVCRPVAAAPTATSGESSPDAYYHFLLGRHYEAQGEIDRALVEHREAARLDPGSAEIRAEIAGLYVRHGQSDEAMREARAALALDPSNREANRLLGQLLSAAAEPDSASPALLKEAVVHLERARRPDGVDFDPALEVALSRLYIRVGRVDDAVAVLERLTELEPQPEAWILLAHAQTTAGRIDEAARALEAGARLNPRLLVSLADLYERHQRWEQATAAYERAATLNPHLPEVKVRWAGALLNLSDEDATRRARALLEEATRAHPNDERALYLLSQAQRRSGDLAGAERTAKRVLSLDPRGLWGPYALAQVYEARHDYRGVVDALRGPVAAWEASSQAPAQNGLALMTRLGLAHLQLGEHDAAIAVFDRARSVPGADSAFDLYLAQAYLAAGRYEDALRTLEPLGASGGRDLRLAQIRARAVNGLGRTDEAVAVLESAVAAHAGEPSAHVSLAALLSESGRHAEALRVLEGAEQRFPGNLTVVFQRGAAHERAKDASRAEAAFRTVLASDPSHAPALNYLGYMLADRGERLDEAVDLIQRALAVDPENASYLDSLGWAYFRKRELDRALEYLRRAAGKLPSNSVVQDHYGDALSAAGRHADAIAAWERALAGDRDSVDVTAIERKVRGARDRVSR